VPTLAVIVAPPAVGGIALFDLTDSAVTPFPRYRRLPFSLGFWSFTFPTAAVVAYTIDWLAVGTAHSVALGDAGAVLVPILSAVLAVLFTLFVAVIGFRSLRLIDGARSRRRAEAVLARADDVDARTTR
jgi:tellurite resistance protein TehA-like permease